MGDSTLRYSQVARPFTHALLAGAMSMIRSASSAQDLGLLSGLSPTERVLVWAPDKAGQLQEQAADLVRAFERGNGAGLLELALYSNTSELGAGLGFWRELAQAYLSALCAGVNPTNPDSVRLPELDADVLERLADAVPPMLGSELVSAELLGQLCQQLGAELNMRSAAHGASLENFLESQHSSLHVAGRVALHLAENPDDAQLPFAFIATYARRRPGSSTVQFVPLNRALQEYAGQGNRQSLLELLVPLQRAAQLSPLLRELVDSGNIYHPLAWTADQAYAFLEQSDAFDATGLVLMLPDWWLSKKDSRPQVSVTLGELKPASMGFDALLDFDLELTLGGQALSEAEIEALLRGSPGLMKLKGAWVHMDPAKLRRVLDYWHGIGKRARTVGLTFLEAMRLVAGAELTSAGNHAKTDLELCPEWSQVIAGKWLGRQLDALRSPAVMQAIEENAGLKATLRPYQKLGVQWLWTLYGLGLGGCLADDMGLGKTIQVIALLSLLKAHKPKARRPASAPKDLLIVPASLLINWRDELKRFSPHLKALIAHPSQLPSRQLKQLAALEIDAHDLVITTYGSAMRTPWIAERAWRCIVLDEAQAIKNPGARQTRAIKTLQAAWRLALTGTPVENRLGDLWSIFDFINPGLLGPAKRFQDFCRALTQNQSAGYRPLRRLLAPYIMRRMKTDKNIISDLPDKTEINTYCLLSRAQAALYKESVGELKRELKTAAGIQRRGLVLSFLLRFKQICNHPSHWLDDSDYAPLASGKFQRLAELVGSIAARQEKLLVFTQFARLTTPLCEHLSRCFGQPGLVLHGGTPIKSRHKLVRQFQEEQGVPFMVLSLKAGGTGLNLTAANHVVHFDRWWNPAVENQATDRAFRIGQKRNVLVHKFICKGTIEERIDRLISSKQELSDEVLNSGAEKELTELSNEELIAMVSLDLDSALCS